MGRLMRGRPLHAHRGEMAGEAMAMAIPSISFRPDGQILGLCNGAALASLDCVRLE